MRILNLHGNCGGAEGAVPLGEALKVNSRLTTLRLSHNELRSEGGMAIADALLVNSMLISVEIIA